MYQSLGKKAITNHLTVYFGQLTVFLRKKYFENKKK